MNFGIIKRTVGWILLFEAAFFLVPLIIAAIYWEAEFFAFLICMGICAALGGLCLIGKPKSDKIYAKEGFVITALCWIVLSAFGALPFVLAGTIPNYIDALFETVSGFTTTGATVIDPEVGVESLPKCMLMWRSFTHWVGGMGVLVFIMAFLPLSGARNMHIMKAESPGPTVGKLVPRVRKTAAILYGIYGVLTLVQVIMLLCGGMSLFDAINTAFATAGTGGFSVKNDGLIGYNSYIQIVVTVFMLIFSINFNSYYLLIRRKWKEVLTEEVKWFLIIVASAILAVTLNVFFTETVNAVGDKMSFGEALKHAAFSVASIVSTTGFATEDFNTWPVFSHIILVGMMFIGACAGSTGGGIKVSRLLLLGKSTSNEIGKMLHPKRVKRITMDGRAVDDEVVRSVYGYMIAYVIIFIASLAIISLDLGNLTHGDSGAFTTGFTAVAATFNNIGPGLGAVGPTGSFTDFSWWSKLVFIFDMLAGRLEIFPMLILFAPMTWKKCA